MRKFSARPCMDSRSSRDAYTPKNILTEPWISDNFSMVALKQWLEGKSKKLEMPLLQKDILRETTPCGWVFNKNFPWSTAQCIIRQPDIYMDIHEEGKYSDQFKSQKEPAHIQRTRWAGGHLQIAGSVTAEI